MKTTYQNSFAGALTLAALLISSPIALAENTKAAGRSESEWVAVKHLTFTDDDIEGMRQGPDGERIDSVQRSKHHSLIEIRESFRAEIMKTAEDM